MRKFLTLAAASAIAVPALAQDAGAIVLEEYGTFDNRGQCVSALAHERNDQRKNPETRGAGYEGLSGSDFNRASLTTTRCEQMDDGSHAIVFYDEGFPDAD